MCFRRAADLGSSDAAFNLGNVLAEQERWLDAARAFELAITRGDTEAWVSLGWVLHELGDLAGEIRAYQQAETAGDSGGTLGLAFALREQGDREAAMGAAQRAAAAGNETAAGVVTCWQWDLTQDPLLEDALRAGAEHYPSARADLGHLLQSTGRVEAARQVWEQGMGRGEVESMLPLGNLYADVLDDEAAAEAAYLAATELGDAHAHNNLAILLEDRGDLEAAGDALPTCHRRRRHSGRGASSRASRGLTTLGGAPTDPCQTVAWIGAIIAPTQRHGRASVAAPTAACESLHPRNHLQRRPRASGVGNGRTGQRLGRRSCSLRSEARSSPANPGHGWTNLRMLKGTSSSATSPASAPLCRTSSANSCARGSRFAARE